MMRNLVGCKHCVPDNTSYWCSWASPVSHTFDLAHSLWTLAKWMGLQFIRTSPHACLPFSPPVTRLRYWHRDMRHGGFTGTYIHIPHEDWRNWCPTKQNFDPGKWRWQINSSPCSPNGQSQEAAIYMASWKMVPLRSSNYHMIHIWLSLAPYLAPLVPHMWSVI